MSEQEIIDSPEYTLYRPGEKQRLKVQGEINQKFISLLFKKALDNKTNSFIGLDIGCSQGDLTFEYFSKFDSFKNVIGLDIDTQAIQVAKKKAAQDFPNWVFEHLSVDDPQFSIKLKQLLDDLGASQAIPVLVHLSVVLHHFKNPEKVLKDLERILPLGSKLIIRTVDDGNIIGYPDQDGLLQFLIEAASRSDDNPDRYHGRKLYGQLIRSKYINPEIIMQTKIISDFSKDEREIYFDTLFSYRRPYLENYLHQTNSPLSELDKFDQAFEKVRQRVKDPEFFFSYTSIGAIAEIATPSF